MLNQRRCSFCRNIGHNILNCRDERLTYFEDLCYITKIRLGITGFRSWLLMYSIENINIVKAYAIRYCNCSMRNDTFIYINGIIEKICQITEDAEMQNEIQHYDDTESETNFDLETETVIDINMASRIFLDILLQDRTKHNKKFNVRTKIIKYVNKNMCECNICYNEIKHEHFVKLNCGHEFCKECIKQTFKHVTTKAPQCAFCRAEINNLELSSETICNEFNDLLN